MHRPNDVLLPGSDSNRPVRASQRRHARDIRDSARKWGISEHQRHEEIRRRAVGEGLNASIEAEGWTLVSDHFSGGGRGAREEGGARSGGSGTWGEKRGEARVSSGKGGRMGRELSGNGRRKSRGAMAAYTQRDLGRDGAGDERARFSFVDSTAQLRRDVKDIGRQRE